MSSSLRTGLTRLVKASQYRAMSKISAATKNQETTENTAVKPSSTQRKSSAVVSNPFPTKQQIALREAQKAKIQKESDAYYWSNQLNH